VRHRDYQVYRILKFVMGSFSLNFLLLEESSILRDLEVTCLIIVTGPVWWLGRPHLAMCGS
jgi:hypothetical protein